jgi:hypothetical protein
MIPWGQLWYAPLGKGNVMHGIRGWAQPNSDQSFARSEQRAFRIVDE